MTTHITYKTAKALKDFLKESAPEPMAGEKYVFRPHFKNPLISTGAVDENEWRKSTPAYQLHDLLSKPFCKAMAKKIKRPKISKDEYYVSPWDIAIRDMIVDKYYQGGLPAVEAELMKMMEAK